MSDLSRLGDAFEAVLRAGETLEDLPERVDAILTAAEAHAHARALLAVVEDGLHPDRDYLPEQAAAFLGMKQSSYNALSKILLPRRKGGYARGVDIMAYRGDLTREQAEAYKRAQREAVLRMVA